MGSKARARAGLFLAAMAVASAFSGGCAEERDPINRVQLGAMPKSFFVGEKLEDKSDDPEFYFRTTVVDVAAGAGSDSLITSSDAQPTTRIRWEITEDKLIGRLAYELIEDTDGRGKSESTPMDAPKAANGGTAPPASFVASSSAASTRGMSGSSGGVTAR